MKDRFEAGKPDADHFTSWLEQANADGELAEVEWGKLHTDVAVLYAYNNYVDALKDVISLLFIASEGGQIVNAMLKHVEAKGVRLSQLED